MKQNPVCIVSGIAPIILSCYLSVLLIVLYEQTLCLFDKFYTIVGLIGEMKENATKQLMAISREVFADCF